MDCEKCPFITPVCTALGNVCYLKIMEHAPNATLEMARMSRTSLSDVADYILRKRESDGE
jgi:hypothetical protein